jgi:pilus assembly protein CpaE
MNAHFNAARASQRESFMAFVCDDANAETLRSVATEQGWSADKVNKGGIRNAVESLSVAASPHILFVDLSESSDPLEDISALAEVCEPGTVVIATGIINDVRLYRDLLASGIQDYLLKPFSQDQLRDAFANAQMILFGPRVADTATEKKHVVAAVVGTRGGVGASTIAASLAWMLGEKSGRNTALLDLDIHFGTGALCLDLEPGRGLTDAVENPSRIDGLFIERSIVRANEKLGVLSAEAPLHQPLVTDGTAFFQLQEELRNSYEGTVLDLPRPMLLQYPHLLHEVQVLVLVVEFTLACARDAIRLLAWLKTNAPQARVVIAANKAQASGGQEVNRKDFEQSIERPIDLVLPFEPKSAAEAAKLGQPLAKVGKGKIAATMAQLVGLTLEVADEEQKEEPGGGSLLSKFNLKELMPRKTKAKA